MSYGALIAPASRAVSITTSDTGALYFTGLYVGGAGDVKVDMEDGDSTVTFSSVPAGTVLPIRISRVYATGTTATNLVGLSGS